jgi:hypothetical protein
MHVTRRPRATGALLALVCCLALLEPGVAGRAAADAHASGSPVAGPVAGPGQGLLQGRPGRSLVVAGGTRDERERPGPALPGLLALAVAAAATLVAARRGARPAGHRAVAAAARAPPALRPAAS